MGVLKERMTKKSGEKLNREGKVVCKIMAAGQDLRSVLSGMYAQMSREIILAQLGKYLQFSLGPERIWKMEFK